jgi:hypothetical protein
MSKIAYVIGIVGAGKGHVANRLKAELGDRLEVITGDRLLHLASARLCPYVGPGHNWDWELWKAITRTSDLRSALRRTIQDMLHCGGFPAPATGKLLLGEATLFGLRELRRGFESALNDLGFGVTSTSAFWLNPPPERVLEQIRGRGRQNESCVDEKVVSVWHQQYLGSDIGADFQSPLPDEVTVAIRRFILEPSI